MSAHFPVTCERRVVRWAVGSAGAFAPFARGRVPLHMCVRVATPLPPFVPLQVVYGDTDSMFVHVEGATKERAFEVGKQIGPVPRAVPGQTSGHGGGGIIGCCQWPIIT